MEKVLSGYKKNSKGGLDPIELIKPIDIARDDLVNEILKKSESMSAHLHKMKEDMFNDIRAFVELSAERYDVKLGGKKGNLQLLSYDGQYKVSVAINESIQFDERLQIAKQLIDECITDWSKDSKAELRALINDAFYVGKAGKINASRILGLRRLDIKDKKWEQAMDAISDSIQVSESKEYIRVYKRNSSGTYDLINLDIARL